MRLSRTSLAKRAKRERTLEIFRIGDPVALIGPGWYPLEMFKGDSFRWVSNDAKMHVARLRWSPYAVVLTLEPGPGVDLQPFDLRVLDGSNAAVATLKIVGKQRASFELAGGEPGVDALTLHVDGGGKMSAGDQRTLNFRVFKISVEALSEIVEMGAGLKLGRGWHPLETFNGETFRWAGDEVIVEAQNPQKAGTLHLDLEPGPGVSFAPFRLCVLDASGKQLGKVDVRARQHVTIPLPRTSSPAKLSLKVEGGGKAVPGDTRILNYRAFASSD